MDDKRETIRKVLTPSSELRWGHLPVPFLAEHVAKALAGHSLPEQLVRAMGLLTADILDLTRDRCDRLPSGEEPLTRIEDRLVAFVNEHITELLDVPLVNGVLPALPELAVRTWPTRPRHALLRTGLATRRERLRTATIGQLLDARTIGTRTVLEVTALLETSALLEPEHETTQESLDGQAFVIGGETFRWGRPPAPLLPESLRRVFGRESLPGWLTKDLGLATDATAMALDGSVWKRVESIPPRVIQYLTGLMNYRAIDISDIRVLKAGWTGGDPRLIDWPTRVQNAMTRAGLLDEEHISCITYGDLLAVPALGAKSVLEFAVIADQTSSSLGFALTEEEQEALLAACYEPWAERVRADDPRFLDVAPAYEGTLAELFDDALANPQSNRSCSVAAALSAVRARIMEIEGQPLDVALRGLLSASGLPKRSIDITVRRMGWSGPAPASLQEVGEEFGITRERVRQIVEKSLRQPGNPYLPALERAIEVLNSEAPLSAQAAAELLAERGISVAPFHPLGVQRAAETFSYDAEFHIVNQDGDINVYGSSEPGISAVVTIARRMAGKVGVSNVEELQASLDEGDGRSPDATTIRQLLEMSSRVRFLLNDWFWMPDIPPHRNRLRNQTRKMLSVTPRLTIASIRQGLRRSYTYRRIDLVPPSDVLREFFREHPEFGIDTHDVVTSVEPLDYVKELGDTERIFVEVLRTIPSGLLDRAELEAAVTGRGVNPSTFSVFTTYSPILDHPAVNVWCLRGHDVQPASIEALRDIVATRERPRRTIGYGWEPDGSLSVTTIVNNPSSPVIGIPSDVSRYVADRQFAAITQDGSGTGTIVVDDRGTSWGYGPFLRRRGAEVGDVLIIRFDLAREQVKLLLSDEMELEEG